MLEKVGTIILLLKSAMLDSGLLMLLIFSIPYVSLIAAIAFKVLVLTLFSLGLLSSFRSRVIAAVLF